MNLETSDMLRLLSITLALLAIIPSFQLLQSVYKEKTFVSDGTKWTNYILRALFTFFIAMVFANAAISTLTILDIRLDGISLHNLANIRTLFVNAGILAISVALNSISHKIFNGNTKRTKS